MAKKKPATPPAKRQRLPPPAKAEAVTKYVAAGMSPSKAAQLLAAAWSGHHDWSVAKAIKSVGGWLRKFLSTGSVADLPRSGRRRRVPKEAAQEAGRLLTDGQEVKHPMPNNDAPAIRVPFPSFAMALALCPALAAIKAKYRVKRAALRAAIKKHCPDIKFARLFLKLAFTPARMAERQAGAREMLITFAEDAPRTIYVDETKVVLFGARNDNLKVWRLLRKGDPDVHLLHVGGFQFKPFKVCVYAAVNAELGLVGWQLTTGTEGLGTSLWRLPAAAAALGDKEEELKANPYKVGWWGAGKSKCSQGGL